MITRYINNRFLDCVIGSITLKVLFANPSIKGGRKAVQCINTLDNSTATYSSVDDCTRRLGMKSASSGFINN